MKYYIKCFLGSSIGWLYVLGDDSPREFTSLEGAKECLRALEWYNTEFYSIVDEDGNEVNE